MAVAPDTSSRVAFTTTTSLTLSHTCTGSNLALFVCLGTVGSSDVITGVTYNSVAMTRLTSDFFATVGVKIYVYYLANPATGANNIVASISPSTNTTISGVSFTSASQTAPTNFAAQQTAAAATWAQTLSGVGAGSWTFAYLADQIGRAITAGANTNVLQDGGGQGDHLVDATAVAIGTLNISSFSATTPAVDSIMVEVPVFGSAATVVIPTPTLLLMNVG